MSLGRELDDILAKMRVLAHGPAARPLDAPFIKGGKSTGGAPRDFGDNLHDEWHGRVARLAEAALVDLKRAIGDRTYRTKPPQSKEERDRQILNFEGDSPRRVAFILDLSEDHIRKVRRENERRPHDGKVKD
jgi:hypothetical protein